ncbi:hypothetical protein [Vibrio furnissii]|uniref:hypothetical protein n=1 Tax=Vibrio furnissii TaxID=29494 RepID=UPI003AA8D6E2
MAQFTTVWPSPALSASRFQVPFVARNIIIRNQDRNWLATFAQCAEVGDIANLNQYLDIALAAGINQVDNIQLKSVTG